MTINGITCLTYRTQADRLTATVDGTSAEEIRQKLTDTLRIADNAQSTVETFDRFRRLFSITEYLAEPGKYDVVLAADETAQTLERIAVLETSKADKTELDAIGAAIERGLSV